MSQSIYYAIKRTTNGHEQSINLTHEEMYEVWKMYQDAINEEEVYLRIESLKEEGKLTDVQEEAINDVIDDIVFDYQCCLDYNHSNTDYFSLTSCIEKYLD